MNPAKAAKVEWLFLNEIAPYERNARTHSAANVAKLAASLKEFGWTNPILVNGANEVIAGHGRLLAAQSLGMESAPCLRITHLSAAQVKAYRVADNRLALDSDWDLELLGSELQDINAVGELDLSLTGFDDGELDYFLSDHSEVESSEAPDQVDQSGESESQSPEETRSPVSTQTEPEQAGDQAASKKELPAPTSTRYEVIVECDDEDDQKALYERFKQEGHKVRVLSY